MTEQIEIDQARANLAERHKEILNKSQSLKSNRLSEVKVDLPKDLHRKVFTY
jgi:hypothetical protein